MNFCCGDLIIYSEALTLMRQDAFISYDEDMIKKEVFIIIDFQSYATSRRKNHLCILFHKNSFYSATIDFKHCKLLHKVYS